MNCESQLFGQSTLLHDCRPLIYNHLQFFIFSIFFFYGISCLSLVELVTLLRIVVHHSVDIASFKLLIFRAAGEEGESAE